MVMQIKLIVVVASRTWENSKESPLVYLPGVSYKDASSLAGINCIRVHQKQITKQLFQLVVNNPFNKIYGLLPKKCNGPTYNLRRQKIFDLHKTKTKRFVDTFIRKSSSMAINVFMTCSLPKGYFNSRVEINWGANLKLRKTGQRQELLPPCVGVASARRCFFGRFIAPRQVLTFR